MRPSARTEKLTVQELPDETLVFDHETGKAHCLNRIAGEVWKHCDGNTDAAELAARLSVPADSVALALEQLDRRKLLVSEAPLPARRDALRKLVAAAVMLPAIMTIAAPSALAQASAPPCSPLGTTFPQGSGGCNPPCCAGSVCTFNGLSGLFGCSGT